MVGRHIVPQRASITRAQRAERVGHRACVLWFTGLSGAGKSTLANSVEQRLFESGCQTFVLDGDNFRHGLCSDLGFDDKDRDENIRRAGEVAKLFVDAGAIVLAAFISPFRSHRESVRRILQEGEFLEIHCAAGIEICEERDTKGLYKKAKRGEIARFTGVSSPYEVPENPELKVETGNEPVEASVRKILRLLEARSIARL
jgi:adenylylsulfate kinase